MSDLPQTPSARLAQSRAALRASLQDAAPAGSAEGGNPRPPWLDAMRANPGVSLVAGMLGQWWSRHPLRFAATLAASATKAAVQPFAERHPWRLLAGACVVGGLLAWSRPWRWPRAALWTGLLPQLLMATVRAAPTRPEHPPEP
ncbi:MAG TPA: hypothetical protein VFQ20_07325 [Burkholderiaceae bacterium]|nr:hypothetical protein [Burkholderiaceae bacterium]